MDPIIVVLCMYGIGMIGSYLVMLWGSKVHGENNKDDFSLIFIPILNLIIFAICLLKIILIPVIDKTEKIYYYFKNQLKGR